MSNVRTRDYEGRRELDPQCAPDEVDTVPHWRCLGCEVLWPKYGDCFCPVCGFHLDCLREHGVLSEVEVPV